MCRNYIAYAMQPQRGDTHQPRASPWVPVHHCIVSPERATLETSALASPTACLPGIVTPLQGWDRGGTGSELEKLRRGEVGAREFYRKDRKRIGALRTLPESRKPSHGAHQDHQEVKESNRTLWALWFCVRVAPSLRGEVFVRVREIILIVSEDIGFRRLRDFAPWR